MPSHRPRSGTPFAARMRSGCGLLARWLLVLLLAVDLVGSPLHAHVHDSGVDGRAWSTHRCVEGRDVRHAEDVNAQAVLRHSTLAVRVAAETPQLDARAGADGSDSAWWPTFDLVPAFQPVATGTAARATRRPPPLPEYRSLPPDGRAPPTLRA